MTDATEAAADALTGTVAAAAVEPKQGGPAPIDEPKQRGPLPADGPPQGTSATPGAAPQPEAQPAEVQPAEAPPASAGTFHVICPDPMEPPFEALASVVLAGMVAVTVSPVVAIGLGLEYVKV